MKSLLLLGIALFFAAAQSNAAVLRSLTTNIFGDIAKSAALGIAQTVLQPQQSQQQQLQAQQQQQMAQQQQAAMEQRMAMEQQLPKIDPDVAAKIDSEQKMLEKRFQDEEQHAAVLKAKYEELKQLGALEKPQGIVVYQGAGQIGSSALEALGESGATTSEGLMSMEAPIIVVETLPLLPSDQLEVNDSVECALQKLGDQNSPQMKAYKEYELGKIGSGGSLKGISEEITAKESALKKMKDERRVLMEELKKVGRDIAKYGSPHLRAKETFVKQDLKAKDSDIEILVTKLGTLKKQQAKMIKSKGPGTEAAKEEEDEEQNESDVTGEGEGEEDL